MSNHDQILLHFKVTGSYPKPSRIKMKFLFTGLISLQFSSYFIPHGLSLHPLKHDYTVPVQILSLTHHPEGEACCRRLKKCSQVSTVCWDLQSPSLLGESSPRPGLHASNFYAFMQYQTCVAKGQT